jgi:hypothetical protein
MNNEFEQAGKAAATPRVRVEVPDYIRVRIVKAGGHDHGALGEVKMLSRSVARAAIANGFAVEEK